MSKKKVLLRKITCYRWVGRYKFSCYSKFHRLSHGLKGRRWSICRLLYITAWLCIFWLTVQTMNCLIWFVNFGFIKFTVGKFDSHIHALLNNNKMYVNVGYCSRRPSFRIFSGDKFTFDRSKRFDRKPHNSVCKTQRLRAYRIIYEYLSFNVTPCMHVCVWYDFVNVWFFIALINILK